MPEIKNAFIKGKMNKDLDERLVPNGEYRDALNVDVDYSDGSDIGALKNILGNTQRDSISLTNAKCIGVAKDVENSRVYWFITSSAKDLIAEWNYSTNTYDTILVDSGSVLNFNTSNYITGANVIDGFLFFTDNLNEPRQIDIEYWRSQTSGSTGTSTGLSAERITVIKKSPLAAPELNMSSSTRGGKGTAGNASVIVMQADFGASTSATSLVNAIDPGSSFSSTSSDFSKFLEGGSAVSPNYQVGDIIILTHKFLDTTNQTEKTIKARVKLTTYNASATGSNVGTFTATLLNVSEQVPGTAVAYTCILEEDEPLFKEKFPRFAYRYKYNNGQYSCFSPFSNAAFLPDPTVGNNTGFAYNQKEGFNLAMVNSLRSLTITNLNHNIHADVDEIDVLYKDSVSPNCYVVDTIKRASNGTIANTFQVKDDQIFKTVPSNQLLRLFDSVPKKAKAQEVTANRLIYGNYTENFDLKDSSNNDVKPVFDLELKNRYNTNHATDCSFFLQVDTDESSAINFSYTDTNGQSATVSVAPGSQTTVSGRCNTMTMTSTPDDSANVTIDSTPLLNSDRLKKQSIKSKRTYQFGVVYMDEFGRQTPVLTSDSGIIKIGQDSAPFLNQFQAKITSNPPSFATHYKYFIKENSKTTYNFIGQSFYEDDEGFIYIGIPSADVNKVQIEDSIIIKKKRDTEVSDITEEFKVLDKYTTGPPPFLAKPMKVIYSPDVMVFSRNFEQDHDQIIIKPGSTPVPGRNRITLRNYYKFSENAIASSHTFNQTSDKGVSREAYALLKPGVKVKFTIGNQETKIYEIETREVDIANNDDIELHFTEQFGDDVKILYESFPSDGISFTKDCVLRGGDPDSTSYAGGVKMLILEEVDESGKEEYQGLFFIKIKSDSRLLDEIKLQQNINNLYAVSTMSLDGDSSDTNDPRQFHMYGGGKANTNSRATRLGADTDGVGTPLNPNLGGFASNGDSVGKTGEGMSYAPNLGFCDQGAGASVHQPAGFSLHDGQYQFCIQSDRDFGDVNSNYGEFPFVHTLDKAPSNKNNMDTSHDVFIKFDRSRNQIDGGATNQGTGVGIRTIPQQTADDTLYKITRVLKFFDRAQSPPVNGIGSNLSQFRDGDVVYLIALDQNLKKDLVFHGDTGHGNVMQMTLFEYRDKNLMVNIPVPPIFEVLPKDDVDIDIYYETQEVFSVSSNHGNNNLLSYYNCFSFENGVESFVIRDDFNGAPLGKGVRVSTVFEDKPYVEEVKKNSLIFSQIYNNKSSLNRLNQFIIAEDITKDINPDYGSIQLLHTRYNDIIAYCENKVLKILTNKDALFNADGNVNITSNKAVLGQSMPYNSNYGISTNPESFAAYTHRSYFTDRKNGVVVRHSMDGMEAISDYGMKDFFRDSLAANSGLMVGSYDVKKHQYNLSTHETNANSTVSFSESTNGWVSKKSFIPEAGFSLENKYFTFKNGHIFEHHVNAAHGNFYGSSSIPYVEFLLNEAPANMKNFRTLNYEGDSGWTCASITTDQQDGDVSSFIEKENKYFNYIKGVEETETTLDVKALNVQGIGTWNSRAANLASVTLTVNAGIPPELQIGDKLYEYDRGYNLIGAITGKTATTVTASTDGTGESAGSSSAVYLLYVKDARWQTSGLLGYFAKVKMQNIQTTSKEIYSVGSEISISS